MKVRLAWSDTDLLRSLLGFLDYQVWMKWSHSSDVDIDEDSDYLAEVKTSVENNASHFTSIYAFAQ